mgnify:CR=1 FL=1
MKHAPVLAFLTLLAWTFGEARAADAVEVVAPDSAPVGSPTVEMKTMKYTPANLEIEAGTTVVWQNHDVLPHNVQIGSPLKVVGEMVSARGSLALRFNEPGTYSYVCTPHPFMRGSVIVKPNSWSLLLPQFGDRAMWIPYNLLAPLKAESPKLTIAASEADASERNFVVGYYLRNPVTRTWDCDILVAENNGARRIEIGGRLGKVLLTANSAGKLEQIIYTLPATSAEAALAASYKHVIKRLDVMILQHGRGIEVAGWQIADVEHQARWRCVPFRPSSLTPLPDLRDTPPAYDDVIRLYREARCTTSVYWRLVCAGAILDAAVRCVTPFDSIEENASDAPLVTTDMLIRSGAIVSQGDLKGASLTRVRDRIEPHRQALLGAMLDTKQGDERTFFMASDYEAEASIAALANLADLIARDLILERLRAEGCVATSAEIGREPLELAGELARLS